MIVAVVGGTGFIGSACVEELGKRHEVRVIQAPRFNTRARSLAELRGAFAGRDVQLFAKQELGGVDVIVNAAGIATATSTDLSSLLGANAILPLFLATSAAAGGVHRFVHVSSAAVQGRLVLDESERLRPENCYALSKALGEVLLREQRKAPVVRYRPTSVQGRGRLVTQQLIRLAESPFATVAAPGNDPSPQISVDRAAQAVCILVESETLPPRVVLHPWEGVTTRSLMMDLGEREPRIVNRQAAKWAMGLAYATGHGSGAAKAQARRLEMLLLGQRQQEGWLSGRLSETDPEWLKRLRLDSSALP